MTVPRQCLGTRTGQPVHMLLFASGATSRRGALAFLASGRVAINGEAIIVESADAAQDLTVDLSAGDVVTLDGRPIRPENRRRYVLVDKPRGVLCAADDSRGLQGRDGKRPLVTSLIPPELGVTERLGHAGRLDLDSEGLVLLTNDRKMMGIITGKTTCSKSYEVTVVGVPSDATLSVLRGGAEIPGIGQLLPCEIEVLERISPPQGAEIISRNSAKLDPSMERRCRTRVRITLREGKNRQIRRMFGSQGHRVIRLVRISIGPLLLDTVPKGGVRELSLSEIEELERCCMTNSDESLDET